MKLQFRWFTLLLMVVLALCSVSFGQTSLTATTLAAAVLDSKTTFIKVTSATGITAASFTAGTTLLYIDTEALAVTSVSGTTIGVQRGSSGTGATAHVLGAMVLIGPPQAFLSYDAAGACTNGVGLFLYSPIINLRTGSQWICSSVLGKVVPGWGNFFDPPAVTAAVASAAGLVTPSGPLFHITGAAAITGFNIPIGFDPKSGAGMCVIPDGAFTTTATNNIAVASTAVVGKVLCFSYDGATSKFYPSY